jgi:opacity protein-like surface antigen
MGRIRRVVVCAALLALVVSPCARAGGLGVGAGVVELEGAAESSLFLTGNVRFKLLGPVNLEPEVGYWKQTQGGAVVNTRGEDLSLGVNGLLVAPVHPLEVFAGAGLGAHFVERSEVVAGLVGETRETRTGVHLLAGLDFRVSDTLNLFGAARRDAFGGESDDPPAQTKFYGGLRFRF